MSLIGFIFICFMGYILEEGYWRITLSIYLNITDPLFSLLQRMYCISQVSYKLNHKAARKGPLL